MTDFRRDVVGRGSPGVHSKAPGPARTGEGYMPRLLMAQPATMVKAVALLKASKDVARANKVQALLEQQS